MNKLPNNIFSRIHEDIASDIGVDVEFDTFAPILIITGPNAAGKSLIRRFISLALKDDDIECIHLSQQGRATSGVVKALLYGSESYESTGVISARTFKGAFNTSASRNTPHVLLWDEPEIGMGEELQLGTALHIREKIKEWPDHLQGIVLLTHSRIIVREMLGVEGVKFLNIGDGLTADEWLNREITPISPEEVREIGHSRYLRISKVLDDIKKRKIDERR